jgi:hypothetical protein
VNSPPPKPEVILTNFFAEPTVLIKVPQMVFSVVSFAMWTFIVYLFMKKFFLMKSLGKFISEKCIMLLCIDIFLTVTKKRVRSYGSIQIQGRPYKL